MSDHRAMRSCRLSDKIYLKVKRLAKLENRSFNSWLESILVKVVYDYEKEHGEIKVDTFEPHQ